MWVTITIVFTEDLEWFLKFWNRSISFLENVNLRWKICSYTYTQIVILFFLHNRIIFPSVYVDIHCDFLTPCLVVLFPARGLLSFRLSRRRRRDVRSKVELSYTDTRCKLKPAYFICTYLFQQISYTYTYLLVLVRESFQMEKYCIRNTFKISTFSHFWRSVEGVSVIKSHKWFLIVSTYMYNPVPIMFGPVNIMIWWNFNQ